MGFQNEIKKYSKPLPNEHVHQGEWGTEVNVLSRLPSQKLYNKKIFFHLTQGNCKQKTPCSQRKSENRNIAQPKQTFQSKAKAN